jgi:hypothetical protein
MRLRVLELPHQDRWRVHVGKQHSHTHLIRHQHFGILCSPTHVYHALQALKLTADDTIKTPVRLLSQDVTLSRSGKELVVVCCAKTASVGGGRETRRHAEGKSKREQAWQSSGWHGFLCSWLVSSFPVS